LINTRPGGPETVWKTPEIVDFVALAFDKILVGLETGLFAFDPASERFEKLLGLDDPGVRFNDAAIGLGYLWASTMDIGVEEPAGAVLRIGPDMKAGRCLDGYRRANGLAVDTKRHRLFVSDSHPERAGIEVAALDPDTKAIICIDPFGGGPARPGRPDGAALDADNNYWIARIDAGLVDVMSPDGAIMAAISVPVPEPTKLAFGGSDGRTIFLTSKAKGPLGACCCPPALENFELTRASRSLRSSIPDQTRHFADIRAKVARRAGIPHVPSEPVAGVIYDPAPGTLTSRGGGRCGWRWRERVG
jgi:sugar lactone lactonase YvrE